MGGFVHGITNAIGITHDSSASNGIQGAYNQFADLQAPELRQLALQQLGPSAMQGVNPDQQAVNAQNTSMDQLTGMATNSGLTPSEQARIQQIQQAANQNAQANRGAALSSSRARGLTNGGMALASQLGANQSATNNYNQAGTDLAAQAGSRQMNAANSLANIGTGVESQRFGEQAQKANAADLISQYNTGLANQQQIYNTQNLPQQNFANQMQLRGTRANLLENKGAAQAAESQQNTQNLVRGATAGMNLLFSDKRLKKNIKDAGPKLSKILDGLNAKSFDYKEEAGEPGPHVGIMAQDLEKTPEGKSAVIDTPMGKAIHPGKVAAIALASSKMLHDKIKKLGAK